MQTIWILDKTINEMVPVLFSSLHWPILGFLYAFFVQWSIFPTKLNAYPILSPYPHFEHFIDVDKYEQLKLAASKLLESEKKI